MCSYIVEKAALYGSAKGSNGWMRVDTATVYYDHPYYTPLDHALAIDFTNEAEGGRERVAVELSAESALALVDKILAALASGEVAHGAVAHQHHHEHTAGNGDRPREHGRRRRHQKLEVVPLTKHIGAEIRGIDLRERPDEATIRAIYQAWLDHLVIVFPGQDMSQEDLLRVTG